MAKRATKTNGTGKGTSANPAPADSPVNDAVLRETALTEGKADEGIMCVPPPRKERGKANGQAKTADATTVTEVQITDGEDQTVVSDGPVGEPKVNQRGTRGKQAVSGAESASGGRKTSASSASKTSGKRSTERDRADKSPKARKGSVTGEKTAKKGVGKASSGKAKTTPKKPSSTITMAELADSYLHHLEAVGKSQGTVHSYGIELKAAVRYFGAETRVATLTAKKVGAYFDSDVVTKNRKGREKDDKTVAKTRRVLRLALVWLAEVGVIPAAPIPETKKPAKKK